MTAAGRTSVLLNRHRQACQRSCGMIEQMRRGFLPAPGTSWNRICLSSILLFVPFPQPVCGKLLCVPVFECHFACIIPTCASFQTSSGYIREAVLNFRCILSFLCSILLAGDGFRPPLSREKNFDFIPLRGLRCCVAEGRIIAIQMGGSP